MPVLLRPAAGAHGGGGDARARRRARSRFQHRDRGSSPWITRLDHVVDSPLDRPLDNGAIARVLKEIADLLEIKNDNPFKIRAYRNGADIASNHPHQLSALDEAGLREIPGIGKDLAARIREIADTGDAGFHRELVAEFPPTILELLN